VSSFDSYAQAAYKASLAARITGVTAADIVLYITSASISVTSEITPAGGTTSPSADDILTVLTPLISDPTALSTALNVTVEEVTEPPLVLATTRLWYFHYPAFEHTMSITARVLVDGIVATSGTLGVFVRGASGELTDSIRGVNRQPLGPVPFGPYNGSYMFFTMLYANIAEGATAPVHGFRYSASGDGDDVKDCSTTTNFVIDGIVGSVISPFHVYCGAMPDGVFPAPSAPPAAPPSPSQPDWAFSTSTYAQTMTLSILVKINDVQATAGTLAAFLMDGDTLSQSVRGKQDTPSTPFFGDHADTQIWQITVYADAGGHSHGWRFRTAGGTTFKCTETFTFVINGNTGSVTDPSIINCDTSE